MAKRRVVVVVVVVIAAAIAVWWWRRPRGDEQASPLAVTHPTVVGSAAVAPPPPTVAARLKVSVRGAQGPVANAAVRLAPNDGEIVVLVADGEGVATSVLEPGSWRIAASAPGHEPAAVARELRAGEDVAVELVLAPGGKPLTGLVTDVNGGPVAGARVDAAGLDRITRASDAVATTMTDRDGRYKLTVAMGQLLVGVSHPDYAPQAHYVDVGAGGAAANFALVPGAVIEGTVRDQATKEPIAGAAVIGRRDRGSGSVMMLAEGGEHRAFSGPDGRFRLAGLRPGAYELSASRERRSSRAPSLVGVGVADQVTDVELLIGTLPVIRGVVVVVDGGAPVPSLAVAALGEGPGGSATAGADGSFVLAGLRPGHYLITASGHDYVLAAGTPVSLATADVDGVRVVVRRGLAIKGHVEPRQICEVSLAIARLVDDLHPAGRDLPPITTGPNGEFAFSPAGPGSSFAVSARCPSGDRGKLEGQAAPGMAEVIVRAAPGASIAGRVVDVGGKPVDGVTVAAFSIGEAEITTVVGGMVTSGFHGITGNAGAFEIVGLAAGTYRLSVLDRGRPMKLKAKSEPVKLAGAEHKTGVELVVERPTGTIKGRVIGPDGAPLADAWVSVHQGVDDILAGMAARDEGAADRPQIIQVRGSDRSDGGGDGANTELPPALTDAQGTFQITGIPAGAWEVLAETQAGALRGRAQHITPDATVEIKAAGVTSLDGTAHGPSGPPALFTVELDGPSPARRTFGGGGGAFSFARLDPGNYVVRVTSSDGSGEAKVTVTAGAKASVDVPLAANASPPKSTGSGAAP